MHQTRTLLVAATIGLAVACAPTSSTDSPAYLFEGEPIVRAMVMEDVASLAVILNDAAHLGRDGDVLDIDNTLPSGTTLVIHPDGTGLRIEPSDGSGSLATAEEFFHLQPASPEGTFSLRDHQTGEPPRQDPEYEGLLEVRRAEDGTLTAIVVLPIEEYLRGVVPSEIGATSPQEAMKAQAVAARSETVTALTEGTYAGPYYDICSTVECQVFRGTFRRTETTDEAIRATRGMILTYDGAPIPAYYSSNAGGHTEDIVNVWPERDRGIPVWSGVYDGAPEDEPDGLRVEENARDWILSRPNVYVNADHHPGIPSWTYGNFRWEVVHTAEDLSAAVARTQDIGRVLRIEKGERGPSGRLMSVRFIGDDGTLEVGPELRIRRTFDPALRSSAIVVEPQGDPERPDAFLIRGAGFGHGVGMCQTGAMARAIEGQPWPEILQHYYVGAELTRAYD